MLVHRSFVVCEYLARASFGPATTIEPVQPNPRELRSLSALIWASFRGIGGAVIGLFGVAGTFAAWFVRPTATVRLPLVVAILAASIIASVTLFEAARRALRKAARPLPRVRAAAAENTPSGNSIVLVLDESPLFSAGILVTVFVVEHDEFESRIATGYVETVREDGRSQVRLTEVAPAKTAVLEAIERNDARVLSRLKVKPFVYTPLERNSLIRVPRRAWGTLRSSEEPGRQPTYRIR